MFILFFTIHFLNDTSLANGRLIQQSFENPRGSFKCVKTIQKARGPF